MISSGNSFDGAAEEVPMITRCSNPACDCLFQGVSNGRFFLLPPKHYDSGPIKLSDFCYWLCPECDPAYTITRIGSEVVIGERGCGTTYSVPAVSLSGRDPYRSPCEVTRRSGEVSLSVGGNRGRYPSGKNGRRICPSTEDGTPG